MNPRLSVCLRTYNQKSYVQKALESALAQRTDFTVEVVIGDDCSTDGTQDLVRDYERRFPDAVRVLSRPSRLGGKRNLAETIAACSGEFVAMLDGDDYWTATHKLQRQVDLLDHNPEMTICGHKIAVESNEGSTVSPDLQQAATLCDFLSTGSLDGDARFSIPHLAVVARRASIPVLPGWYYDVPLGDKAIQMLCGLSGSYGFINEVMGVYRKHAGAEWSRRSNAERLAGHVKLLELSRDVTRRFESVVDLRLMKLCIRISSMYEDVDNEKCELYLDKARQYAPSKAAWALVESKRLLRRRAPWLYRFLRDGSATTAARLDTNNGYQ